MKRGSARALLLILALAGCRRPAAPVAGEVDPLAVAAALPSGVAAPRPRAIRSVYPEKLDGAPDALAERLCRALHTLPEERRGACCAAPTGTTLTGECARVLTAAVRDGAVRLDATEVDGCARATVEATAGCDWVGPFPVAVPAACRGVVHGTVAAGGPCRSSLDCTGALRCRGAGPTELGRCAPALGDGAICGLAVDTLAAFTRQQSVDRDHRECAGHCERHRCQAAVSLGGACTQSSECAPGDRCHGGRCIGGELAALGDACTGADCAAGGRCYQHRCIAPATDGAVCSADFECRGGCVAGRCAARCDRR